jgi:hypothetical protein
MHSVQIVDGREGHGRACVLPSGQLAVAPLKYDDTQFRELGAADTAVNFYEPKDRHNFVITSIVAYADKQVGSSTNATVVVFESDGPEEETVSKVLLQIEIGQNQSIPLLPLNLLVNKGKWINAKTDDDDVHMTIMGYYIEGVDQ